MDAAPGRHQKYLFVCENSRKEGACCMPEGERIREVLKQSMNERGLSSRIRVSRSGCLDLCADGPNVLLMPDNKWFRKVSLKNLDEIIQQAAKGLL